MPRLPRASNRELPVTAESDTPTSAKPSPISAPVSSSSTTGSSASFERRMNAIHDPAPLSARAWRTAVRSERASNTMATSRIAIAHPSDDSSWGLRSFSSAS